MQTEVRIKEQDSSFEDNNSKDWNVLKDQESFDTFFFYVYDSAFEVVILQCEQNGDVSVL